jgi:hypothetical protein
VKPVTAEPQENRGLRPDKAISGALKEGGKWPAIFVRVFLFKVFCASKLAGFAWRDLLPDFHGKQMAHDHSTKVRPSRQEGAPGDCSNYT